MGEAKKLNMAEQIDEWFTYHKPVGNQPERYERIRAKAKELATVIVECTPPCADQTVALRKLREAVQTANASIALEESIGASTSLPIADR